MDDLLAEFLTETAESLSVLDLEIVRLEQEPDDPRLLSNIFRLVHTIKGTCGFLGLPRLERLAHAAENVLGVLREGKEPVRPVTVTLILEALDQVKFVLAGLGATGTEPDGHDQDLIDRLNACAEGRLPQGKAPASPAAPAAPAPAAKAQPAANPWPVAKELLEEAAAAEALGIRPNEILIESATAGLAGMLGAAGPAAPQAREPIPEIPRRKPAAETQPPQEAQKRAAAAGTQAGAGEPAAPGAGGGEGPVGTQTIRVTVDLLENLMTMVSELVLTRNQLLQLTRNTKDNDFAAPLQRLNHVVSELQEGVMKTRMQPIGNAWAKLPRLIRDLSMELGKKIQLKLVGEETELDRQVLELIKDPLTHMVRNSADHGLEKSADRLAAGKPEAGTITLEAWHEGGHILIRISDDGRGLNRDKILAKALREGLLSESDLPGLSDQQIYSLIFRAGLSTAEQVTNVSGRGVGMDVVKTNIEKIGGTIDLSTEAGRGTAFTIKIPLTLAIVSALLVEAGGERFALPQLAVVELVRARADSEHRIEMVKGAPVLRLRDRLLPLVPLARMLNLPQAAADQRATTYVVVTQVGNHTFGLIVDRVFDTEEIVVKPVAPILRHLGVYSGNTILGDGSVVMILDPNGLASAAGGAHGAGTAPTRTQSAAARGLDTGETTTLLLVRAGSGGPKAVPLSMVARLEDLDAATVEISDGQPVVQYRDRIMPLLPFSGEVAVPASGSFPVVVFAEEDRQMGLVVEQILDIVEAPVDLQRKASRPGLMGTAIITGKTTEMVDVGWYLSQAWPDWFQKRKASGPGEAGAQRGRLLLVDDSAFFRGMVQPLLAAEGWQVLMADDGQAALQILERDRSIDLVISDIEMPRCDGFELVRQIRQDQRLADLPVIALSSRRSQGDMARGRAAGFSDWVGKFDRDQLLGAVAQISTLLKGAA